MTDVRGVVVYPVTNQPAQLFASLQDGLTLYLTADSPRIWVGTTGHVRPGIGLPMNPLASVAWDRDKPCYAVTEGPGLKATLVGIDLQATVNDPTQLASLISQGAADGTAIANAIAASGLTANAIAAAIIAQGLTPTNIANAIVASALAANIATAVNNALRATPLPVDTTP